MLNSPFSILNTILSVQLIYTKKFARSRAHFLILSFVCLTPPRGHRCLLTTHLHKLSFIVMLPLPVLFWLSLLIGTHTDIYTFSHNTHSPIPIQVIVPLFSVQILTSIFYISLYFHWRTVSNTFIIVTLHLYIQLNHTEKRNNFAQPSELTESCFICLVQVRLRTEVPRTPSSARSGLELMTSRSWQYISCHRDACYNHSVISDLQKYTQR